MNKFEFNFYITRIKKRKIAFNKIYEEYFQKIIFYISRKYNRLIAEDIAHEFFIKLLSIEIKEKIEFPTTWVFKVCDNIALTYLAKNKPTKELTGLESVEWLIQYTENADLIAAINKMNEVERKIIYLCCFEGYSLREISDLLSVNYANIRKIHERVIKKLKKIL